MASEPVQPEFASHQVVTAEVPSAERTLTLRHDDCFALFNEIGDIDAEARSEAGLYRGGVRYLSRFTLTIGGQPPLLLSANPRDDNVLLTVNTIDAPRAESAERIQVRQLADGFWRLNLRFGFMEDNDVPRALRECGAHGLEFELEQTTFFASRETLTAAREGGMAFWRDRLFLAMARNTVSATTFFRIPGNRLVELGTSVEI